MAAGCDPGRLFIDKASGKLERRPEWDRCLAYLRPGDQLVITRLSRAFRSLKHLMAAAEELRERGIELVVLKQAIDTTTAAGRLTFHIIGALDEFARELIVENTREGLAAARARGRVGGRKPKLSPDQVHLARLLYDEKGPDGRRVRTVAQIAAMLGVSRTTIYRHLEATGGHEPVALGA